MNNLVAKLAPCVLSLASCVLNPLHLSRTLYKSPLFMQNKPNLQKSQMNVNLYNTTDYENKWQRRVRKNKPNSKPIKPNLRKAKMNVNSLITKDYRKKDDFAVRKNKANSKPISEKPKMNVNLYVIKEYENVLLRRRGENKPNQSQFQTRSEAEIPTGELLGILRPGTNLNILIQRLCTKLALSIGLV